MSAFFKNYLSTLLFIWLLYLFYSSNSYYTSLFSGQYFFNIFWGFWFTYQEIIHTIIFWYVILLIPFYSLFPTQSKAYIILKMLKKLLNNLSYKLEKQEKTALLAWGVKWFFAPLMIMWFFGHVSSLISQWIGVIQNYWMMSENFLAFFNQYFFLFAFSFILFLDVLFFTLGYLLEGKIFKNEIISIESTFFWWFVCLACYPPFNAFTNNVFWWYSNDFPQFVDWKFHLFFNFLILILMGIYTWASVSLWLKASNLTNRGIITTGPYKYVRHPAYITKNLSWWIGGIPILSWLWLSGNMTWFFAWITSLFCWSLIYYFRAITEERHLSQDPNYIVYKTQTPNRFIPFLK